MKRKEVEDDTRSIHPNYERAMLTRQYIETVFETLESAREEGVLADWSVKCSNFVIEHDGERVTVAQQEAAKYVTELLQRRIDGAEAAAVQHVREPARPATEPVHWLRFTIS